MMKNSKLLFMLLICLNGFADPSANSVLFLGAHYDENLQLIMPDKLLLTKGYNAYTSGYTKSAYVKFKKAAAFGNTEAQYLLGLMYIKAIGVQRDWAKGYAWVKLSALDESKKHRKYRDAIFAKLKPEEIKQANLEYKKLLVDYAPSIALSRRNKWSKKQQNKIVGSHTGALTAKITSYDSFRNFSKSAGGNPSVAEHSATNLDMFVDDYNFGYVTTGEIIPKNGEGNDKK